VLARAMAAIAGEVTERTHAVSTTLQGIAAAGAGLRLGEADTPTRGGASVAAGLHALVDRVRTSHHDLAEGFRTIRRQTSDLHDEVERLERKLTAQIASADSLEELAEELATIGAEARRRGEAGPPDDGAAIRRFALQRYTMAAEREVHSRVVDGARGPEAPSPGGEPGLGDNVELF